MLQICAQDYSHTILRHDIYLHVSALFSWEVNTKSYPDDDMVDITTLPAISLIISIVIHIVIYCMVIGTLITASSTFDFWVSLPRHQRYACYCTSHSSFSLS